MKTEYPKLIYRSENKVCCTVVTKEQHESLKDYFCDQLDHGLLPYSEISVVEAMAIYTEITKENEDIKISDSEIKNHPDKLEPKPELTDLSWNELRGYGKKIEREYGVELPLKAKRDIVEKSIQEVLNANDSRRPGKSSIS